MEFVFWKTFHFKCEHCNVINVAPIDLFESIFNCEKCGKTNQITWDDNEIDGIEVSRANIEVNNGLS